MVSKNTALISINKYTKEKLDALNINKSLFSYNDIILELISFWRENHKSPEIIQSTTSRGIQLTEANAITNTSTGN